MLARHAHRQATETLALIADSEAAALLPILDIDGVKVSLSRETVGNETFLHLRNHALNICVIEAQYGHTEEGYLVDELAEGLLDLVQVPIEIEVIGIDISDHGDGR